MGKKKSLQSSFLEMHVGFVCLFASLIHVVSPNLSRQSLCPWHTNCTHDGQREVTYFQNVIFVVIYLP